MYGKIIIQVIAMYTKSFRGIRYIRKRKSILMLVSVLSLLSLSGCEQLFPDWYDSLSERGVCFNNLSEKWVMVGESRIQTHYCLSGFQNSMGMVTNIGTCHPEVLELYGT